MPWVFLTHCDPGHSISGMQKIIQRKNRAHKGVLYVGLAAATVLLQIGLGQIQALFFTDAQDICTKMCHRLRDRFCSSVSHESLPK